MKKPFKEMTIKSEPPIHPWHLHVSLSGCVSVHMGDVSSQLGGNFLSTSAPRWELHSVPSAKSALAVYTSERTKSIFGKSAKINISGFVKDLTKMRNDQPGVWSEDVALRVAKMMKKKMMIMELSQEAEEIHEFLGPPCLLSPPVFHCLAKRIIMHPQTFFRRNIELENGKLSSRSAKGDWWDCGPRLLSAWAMHTSSGNGHRSIQRWVRAKRADNRFCTQPWVG